MQEALKTKRGKLVLEIDEMWSLHWLQEEQGLDLACH
jgi:hypothetical protein